jgi:hypothetical protein
MQDRARMPDPDSRRESTLERLDRNLVELLQEVRVIQTGVQVLFAFLLTAPLSVRFRDLSGAERIEYFATLLAAGAAAVLLIAPTAYHRILFRRGDKAYLVKVANRFALTGLACVGLAMVGALLLVTDVMFDGPIVGLTTVVAAAGCLACWCLGPLRRRAQLRAGQAHRHRAASGHLTSARGAVAGPWAGDDGETRADHPD